MMTFQPELLDQLLQGYEKPEDLLGDGGILKQLTQALVERCWRQKCKPTSKHIGLSLKL
ncbi:hypothetical protein [Leptolyngbya sp. Cla-17]|uniref:hypothetical protein n=1 Tax=Leptolyngbya sp. Cla-17 TaxID=2803751 RepID=UPI001F5CEAA9